MEHDDDTDCEFCQGREAAHHGESEDANPYPAADAVPGSSGWYDTQHGLWATGFSIGEFESGRQRPVEDVMGDRERRERVILLSHGFHPPDEFMAAIKREDPDATRMDRAVRVDRNIDDVFIGEHEWSVTYWANTD